MSNSQHDTFQDLLMFAAILITGSPSSAPILVVVLATLIGFNYGANLTLFPSYVMDLCGMKHFGVNYGVLFTAWGFGGLVLSRYRCLLLYEAGPLLHHSFPLASFSRQGQRPPFSCMTGKKRCVRRIGVLQPRRRRYESTIVASSTRISRNM